MKHAIIAFLLGSLIAVFVPGVLAQEADTDGDGLPDAIERQLGTDPAFPEPLQLLLDDRAKGEGDQTISGRHELAPDVTRVYCAHVGGDRFVWKVEFAGEYLKEGSIFHLYTKLDNDPTTGRQDSEQVRGCDIMYSFVDGRNDPRIITPQLRADRWLAVRGVCEGSCIYVCDDVRIYREGNEAVYEWYILSHRRDPTADSDTTGEYREARIPVDTERPAPPAAFGTRENFDALPFTNELRHALWHAEGTVLLPAADARTEGMIRHTNFELETDQQAAESWAAWKCPVAGEYYFVTMLSPYRQGGQGALELLVDGAGAGRLVDPGGRERLFWHTERPLSLGQGAELRLRAALQSGSTRFGEVMLVTGRPRVPQLRVNDIETFHLPDEPGQPPARVKLCWTTNRPAECTLDYAIAGPEAYVDKGTLDEGRGAAHNHFIVFPPGMRSSRYSVTITAAEPQGAWPQPHTATVRTLVEMRPPWSEGPQAEPIELTVAEPLAQGRSWPVRSGLPLPPGRLWDVSRCGLAEAPAQFEVLSRWPDASVKWLVVDLVADTRPGAERSYHLAFNGRAEAPPNPFAISESEQALVVDTGAAQFTLARDSFAPFADVRLDRDGDGRYADAERVTGDAAGFRLVNAEGKAFTTTAAAPEELVVEAAGPVRATVRARGHFTAEDGDQYMAYLCRLHFHANRPWAHVEFSIEDDVLDPRMSLIRSASCRVALPVERGSLGLEGEARDFRGPISLLQDYDSRYLVGGEPAGDRAPGWISVSGPQGEVFAAVRDFWRLYPKGFKASRDDLEIALLPELPEDQYQSPEDQELLTRLYYWCDRGMYKLASGVRVTTQFMLDFDAASRDYPETALDTPLFAACSPEHYCASGVFGPILPRQPDLFPTYADSMDQGFAGFIERRESVREYGFLNHGDWFGERTWNWGNEEYDTQNALAINFARTGNLDMLWAGEDAARHNGDVDTIHYDASASNVGKVHVHCLGHTGGYFPDDWKEMGSGFARGVTTHSHTWDEGHFAYGGLTGNRRYWDNGRLVADEMAAGGTATLDFGSERDVGWRLVAMMGAYCHTSDPFYLNAARLQTRLAIWKQRPENGQWGHYLDRSECRQEEGVPRAWGAKPFMTGVLLHGLMRYDVTEPSQVVKDTMVRNADFIWGSTYIRADRGFIYSQCPPFLGKGGTWTMSLIGDGLAYACLQDPRRQHLDLVKEALQYHLYRSRVSGFGKSFTQGTCFTPFTLKLMADLGVRDLPDPGPAEQASRIQMREFLALAPGATGTIRPTMLSGAVEEVPCELRWLDPTPGWFELPETPLRWQAPPGRSLGPELRAAAPAEAAAGDVGRLSYRLRVGKETAKGEVIVEAVEPREQVPAVGWLTADQDPLRLAAEALGLQVAPVADLAEANLGDFGALVLGSEGFSKDFAGVQEAYRELQRFVVGGGLLLVGQIQDSDWRTDVLPLDLVIRDDESAAGEVLAPDHALFTRPNPIAPRDLAGVICYDTCEYAGPGWRVLMTCADGSPAVLEADCGAGRVLVVLPSFDRPVYDDQHVNADRRPACTQFMQNLFANVGAAPG